MKPFLFRVGLAALLFAISAAVGLVETRLAGFPLVGFESFVSVSVPASASALFLASIVVFPSTLPSEKLRYPLNLTLPLIHISLIFIVAHLAAMREASIVSQSPGMEPILAWTTSKPLLSTLAAEGILLTALAGLVSRSGR
jgi:hypothetical protein